MGKPAKGTFGQDDSQMCKLSHEGLQLPSIALCNRAYFSRRKLKALNVSSSLTNYLYGITGTINAVNNEFLKTGRSSKYMSETHEELMALLAEKNLTFRELVDAVSYDCEDMLLMCTVANIRMSAEKCCSSMPSIATFAAKCYIFYTNGTNMQALEGEYLGVSLYLKVNSDDYPVLDPEIMDMAHFLKTGLQISVFSNQTHPSIPAVGQGVSLVPKIYTTIEVSLSVVSNVERKKTLYDWNEKQCVPASTINYNGDQEIFFNTQPNCRFSAMRNCFKTVNNCSHYALDNNLGEEKKCRDPCIRYDYTHATSHTPIQQAVYKNLHSSFNLTNTYLIISLNEAKYGKFRLFVNKVLDKSYKFNLCEIGGITGLLLGVSIVTMIEVIVAWVLCFNIMIRNIRAKFFQRVRPNDYPGEAKTYRENTIIGVSKFSFSVQESPENGDNRVQLRDNFLGAEKD
ncbi:LOW QUALITY PROTEIN: sodium channel protein Nach-like [Palaemon carinicauda]|uniref:LOW QUALITY PROTEIN: sodium channel protein Nach-like n=1 Tax=Palaemon carinicauda TaxID=392227 RepID=UPI0035B589D1